MNKKITLTNDFHNSTCNVTLLERRKIDDKRYEISASTYRKIKNTLCGISDCMCHITRGEKKYKVIAIFSQYNTYYIHII